MVGIFIILDDVFILTIPSFNKYSEREIEIERERERERGKRNRNIERVVLLKQRRVLP